MKNRMEFMKEQYEKAMDEIKQLGEIKEICWSVVVDDTFRNIPKVIFIGEKGKTLEKVLQDPGYHPFDTIANWQIITALRTAFHQKKIPMVYNDPENVHELADMVNEARKKFPYTGNYHINEERSKEFFHICPEYRF